MFSVAFLKAAGERAAKTFLQTAAALLLAGMDKVDLFHLEYRQIALSALSAAVLSVLTSVGSTAATPTVDAPLPADELDEPAAPVADEATVDPNAAA